MAWRSSAEPDGMALDAQFDDMSARAASVARRPHSVLEQGTPKVVCSRPQPRTNVNRHMLKPLMLLAALIALAAYERDGGNKKDQQKETIHIHRGTSVNGPGD